MSEPPLVIELNDHDVPYWPGETISGQYSMDEFPEQEVKATELSILWHTVGQGDEDLAVHHFSRLSAEESADAQARRFDFDSPQRFQVALPKSPLSYDGVLVKIRWCVRLRVFLARGRELVVEKPFQLGAIPPARIVTP